METSTGSGRVDPFTLYRLWRADLARVRPPETARHYRRMGFYAFADLGHPLEWTAGQLEKYLRERLTPQHANQVRKPLADLTAWMVAKGYREEDPLEEVPRRRGKGRRIRRGLDTEELVQLVIAAAHGWRWRGRWAPHRERAALLMLAQFYTGARPGEIASLRTSEVHLHGQHPHVEFVGTKTDADRIVPIAERARPVFERLLEGRVGRISNTSVRTYTQYVGTAARLAGLPKPKCRAYALRHSFAGHLVDAGVHPVVIAQLMGHSDLRTVLDYTWRTDRTLREAVEVLP